MVTLIFVLVDQNNASALEYSNYTSSKSQFQFQFPAEWNLKQESSVEQGPEVTVSDNNSKFIASVLPDFLRTTSSPEERVHKSAKFYQDVLSRKIVEEPIFGKYNVGGKMAASLANEHEDDDGKSLIQLEIYADHGDERYFFDFTSPKESFFNDETEEIRNRIIDSIVFTDEEN